MSVEAYVGVGIAFGSLCFAGAQVAMTAIKSKASNNSIDAKAIVYKDTCEARHGGIQNELRNINETLQTVLKAVNRL